MSQRKTQDEVRSKVRGMFLGVSIGDALGMPVETWTPEKIKEIYGRVESYLAPTHHKWFKDDPAATTTDDTQLTLAVAEALIDAPLCMEKQAEHHVKALRESTRGWGTSTKNAVRDVANGKSWTKSAGGGVGNGVAMKISPVGLLMSNDCDITFEVGLREVFDLIKNLSQMTHGTECSFLSSAAHAFAIKYCFESIPEDYDSILFSGKIGVDMAHYFLTDEIKNEDNFALLYETVRDIAFYEGSANTDEQIIAQHGGGSCYCYHSVPFSHRFFDRNPNSIEALYDVVNAGGDTDSNGSMVGALLGALHGEKFFPEHLVEPLVGKERVLEVADRFVKKFF